LITWDGKQLFQILSNLICELSRLAIKVTIFVLAQSFGQSVKVKSVMMQNGAVMVIGINQ
jgi:hypothetical protein